MIDLRISLRYNDYGVMIMKLSLFEIVKTHVDCLDRMGLLDMGAPEDEYDPESRMICDRITAESTPREIALIMADVFSKMFSQEEAAETYRIAAQRIWDDLQLWRKE